MRYVNQYHFYQLGMYIHPLTNVQEGQTLEAIVWELFSAKNWLEYLLTGRMVPTPASWQSGQALLEAVNSLIELWKPSKPEESSADEIVLNFRQAYDLRSRTQTFETILSAELQNIDTYFVSQKGIYSTSDLIDQAEQALEEGVRAAMPEEAVQDFKQAGRCLALELSTASGFHVMRATEAVLKKWYALVVPSGRARVWAHCVAALTTAGADGNTLAVLDQIRQLHGNPLMHPEIFLTVSESLRLFDIAKSAIIAMAEQIIAHNEKQAAAALGAPVATHNIPQP